VADRVQDRRHAEIILRRAPARNGGGEAAADASGDRRREAE
jgi:hypothetical protein